MARAGTNRSPAFLASALLHAAVVAAALITWPFWSKPVQLGKVVPVTLVTDGPPADLAPAIQAPEPAPAMAPEPVPEAPPAPAPISSAPPTPPAPAASAPKAAPEPAKPSQAKPTPALKPAPSAAASAKQGLDLDALMASLSSSPQRASTQQTSGQQGAARPRTAPEASDRRGTDDKLSASELDALRDKLQRLWNPNCQVEAAAGINVKVRMRLTPQGFLAGAPELVDRGDIQSSGDALLIAAAQRALSAVKRGEPYSELRPEHYAGWRELIVNFNAKQACAK